MTLGNGTRLGPYEILSLIGTGGMGEVYRARDTRLGREVAVKILPAAFAEDKDRLRRFEQEARAAGMLNHPNILAVYDVGTQDGSPYVVSELLEGQTLRDALTEAALPLRKGLDYALQIARGLAAAHEKGIVHRDLKPENLFIVKDGRVKILDFGLAKLVRPVMPDEKHSALPTVAPGTEAGMVLGTVGYMSPEQVLGRPTDHRSDVFAYGAILYEILLGKRAFKRNSAVETMNAILKEDPPELSETNPNLPPALERIVRRCMEKSPDLRFQSASDLAFAIEALSQTTSSVRTIPPAKLPVTLGRREGMAWVLAAIAVVAAILFPTLQPKPTVAPPSRLCLSLSPPDLFAWFDFSISPEGDRVAFGAIDEVKNALWLRDLKDLTAKPILGTENAGGGLGGIFWSPDGRSIAFFADKKLKKIDVTGGTPQTLCDARSGRGGSWNQDGIIIFAPNDAAPIYQISSAGGEPKEVTQLDASRKDTAHFRPMFLPDGRHFLLSVEGDKSGLYLGSLDSKTTRFLASISWRQSPTYAAGYVLFLRDSTLMAQRLDLRTLEMKGDPFPFPISKVEQFAATDRIMVVSSPSVREGELVWYDRAGKKISTLGQPEYFGTPRISPDGRQVAISIYNQDAGRSDLWLYDVQRNTSTQLTYGKDVWSYPVWSPDGKQILYTDEAKKGLSRGLYCKSLINEEEKLLIESNDNIFPTSWSPDARYIAYAQYSPKTYLDQWILPMFGDQKPFLFLNSNRVEGWGLFSPDGKWLSYVSGAVFVRPFPGPGTKIQVSTGGGGAAWRRDGKEMFYMSYDNKLMAVDVIPGNTFTLGAEKTPFQTPESLSGTQPYDVTADGQRFLVFTPLEKEKASPVTVILNWTEGLNR